MFNNSNAGFFFRDKVWLLVGSRRNKMSTDDIKNIEKFEPVLIKKNIEYKLNYNNQNSAHGLGWSVDYKGRGIWTEGNISTILFRLDNNNSSKKYINLKISSLIKRNNEALKVLIDLNGEKIGTYDLTRPENLQDKKIIIDIPPNKTNDNVFLINLKIINPTTPLDLRQSPDARQLGLLVESLEIKTN